MRKNNQYIVIGLSVALGIAVLVIAYLYIYKGNSGSHYVSNHVSGHVPDNHHPPQVHTPAPEPNNPKTKPSLVMFYANWCGFSKQAMPEWEKLKSTAPPYIQILDFEEKIYPEEIKKNSIQGYPTIRVYPDGYQNNPTKFIDYKGPRKAEEIAKFVQSNV
jgi:thiol-disulfide isomerase/thioredoxin